MKDTPKPAFAKVAWGIVTLLSLTGTALAAPQPDPQTQQPAHAYSQLPLRFEPNQGQTAPQVRFLAHGPGYNLFLTATEAILTLADLSFLSLSVRLGEPPRIPVLYMTLKGANPEAAITGQALLPGKVNYLLGNDPAQWHTNIPTYARVKYDEIYPGIDLIYYGRQQQLEFDFIIEPGADPKAIHLAFTGGVEKMRLLDGGQLVLTTFRAGKVRLRKPTLYQKIGGEKYPVAGGYVRQGPHQVGFRVGPYNPNYPLIIDPVLSYSTYLYLEGDGNPDDIATDSLGLAYITGDTHSVSFPFIKRNPTIIAAVSDVFVTKLNRAGDALIYTTYLGGSSLDRGHGIAVDLGGRAYVTGSTKSSDFPVRNALQPTFVGGVFPVPIIPLSDAFVAKLNRTGDGLVYSTYLGGRGTDVGRDIAVDFRGQAYITGSTSSSEFPVYNALQPTLGEHSTAGHSDDFNSDTFVTKLSPLGDAVYSTYLGGSGDDDGHGVAVDFRGQAYVTGSTDSSDFPIYNALQPALGGYWDGFVAKFSPMGDALVYSTYLGGSGSDDGRDIAVDFRGQAYITGRTSSSDFPVYNALQPTLGGYSDEFDSDAFVTKLSPIGDALVYSTYLGGSENDGSASIALHFPGQAYITGQTSSSDFPVRNALQPTYGGGTSDAFVAKLNWTGNTLVYSTYLGGSGNDSGWGIAVGPLGQAYMIEETVPTSRSGLLLDTCYGSSNNYCGSRSVLIKLTPQWVYLWNPYKIER